MFPKVRYAFLVLVAISIWSIPSIAEEKCVQNDILIVRNKKVLDPSQFRGRAKQAYEAAKNHANLMKNLFLYDGSDIVNECTSLLDSFTSTWAADMALAQEEAIDAASLEEKGFSLKEIQKFIDTKYSHFYPSYPDMTKDSAALQKYKKSISVALQPNYLLPNSSVVQAAQTSP